ncbi:MAG: hypothetical protein OXM55_00805 [Bdellovibrionales bacterium]|nr:hypothetical protein [Bdellovibrionales bacterium]
MDFNNLKEEFINISNNVYSSIINSSGFYFIKEKYDHLSSLHRKLLQGFCLLMLLVVLLYYPTSYLYSSWNNMREANIKYLLTRELMNLSPNKNNRISSSYFPGQDPVKFIEQRIPVLQIPKNQIQQIKKTKAIQQSLPLSTKVEMVAVEMQNLNLQEIVEYGYKLEQLSNNIKLTHLRIKENPNKNDYFNVSYALSFFSPTTDTSLDQKPKMDKKSQKPKVKPKKAPPPTRIRDTSSPVSTNDKIFDNLKTPSPSHLPSPALPLKKFPNQKKTDKKKANPLPLMKIKKAHIKEDSHFEKRPEEIKKRDLLPALPMPKKQPNSLNISAPPPPPPPSADQPPSSPPDNNTTTKKDK